MRVYQAGFALPTILISAVVMLIVLVSAAAAASSVNTALDRQFYEQLARQAAESGVVRAVDCLKSNNYTPQWGFGGGSGDYLYSASPCTGASYTCVSAGTCLLIPKTTTASSSYRTHFRVLSPSIQGDSYTIISIGEVDLLRSDNTEFDTIQATATLRIDRSTSVDDVDAIIFGD